MNLSTYLADWIQMRRASGCKPGTMEQYEYYARTATELVGDRDMNDISSMTITAMYAPYIEAGHIRSAQLMHTVMRMAFRDAVKMDLVKKNPTDVLKKPRGSESDISPLMPSEAAELVRQEHGELWKLLLITGMRRGEAVALQWSSVDFQRKEISITENVRRVKGKLIIGTPKSKSGKRKIPITDDVCAMLRRWRVQQLHNGIQGNRVISDDGRLLEPSTINAWIRRDSDAAGIDHVTPHMLRHTFAADGVSAGIDIRVLQALMGHADIQVTARYYAFVREDVLRTAIARISAL